MKRWQIITPSLTKQLFLQLWPKQSQKKKRAIPASLEDSCITGAGEGAASSWFVVNSSCQHWQRQPSVWPVMLWGLLLGHLKVSWITLGSSIFVCWSLLGCQLQDAPGHGTEPHPFSVSGCWALFPFWLWNFQSDGLATSPIINIWLFQELCSFPLLALVWGPELPVPFPNLLPSCCLVSHRLDWLWWADKARARSCQG